MRFEKLDFRRQMALRPVAFRALAEGRHGGGRFIDFASLEVMRGGGLRLKV